MNVISAEEFRNKITPGDSSTQKIYQDKVLIQGPVFALDSKTSAVKYCNTYLIKNPQSYCLLVREESYFQLWKEELKLQTQTKTTPSLLSENTATISPSNNLASSNSNSSPKIDRDNLLEFIHLCQQLLCEAIGPVGNIICKKISSHNPDLTCQEFIKILAKKIPALQESSNFEAVLLEFVETNLSLNISLNEMSKNLQNSSIEIDVIIAIDLEKITNKMRGREGITIKDRFYDFKVYSNCFIGSEAITWMRKNLNLSTEQSIRLGQRLIDEKRIDQIADRQIFENKHLLYRFY